MTPPLVDDYRSDSDGGSPIPSDSEGDAFRLAAIPNKRPRTDDYHRLHNHLLGKISPPLVIWAFWTF